MTHQVRETAAITEAAAVAAKKTGRMMMQFISPGWGSSGYYSPEVLEQAVTDDVIPAGTHMYADHPTESEDLERPVRSIKDLMAVTAGPSRLATEADVTEWDADLGALVGEVQVVPQWRDLLETVKDSIGASIRGSATDIVEGEAEGRTGRIIEGLMAPVLSVDFVTRAGRGGRVLSVLESAAVNRRAISHGIAEATANDQRDALSNLVRDAYGSGGSDSRIWVWLRDFDDTTAWFEVEGGEDGGLFAQDYTADTDDIPTALTGTRTEVTVRTTYVPVSPAGQPNTQESKEDTMATTQIEESALAELRDQAGRVNALESERDTVKKSAEVAESRAITALGHARKRVREANADLPAATVDRIVAEATRVGIPAKDDGQLDEAAFDERLDAAREAEESYLAGLASEQGAGSIKGFGATESQSTTGVSVEDFDAEFETKES